MKQPALKPAPQQPADFIPDAPLHIAEAFKALHRGEASDYQQTQAMGWLLAEACGKSRFPYHPSERDTAFALGRHFVADILIGFINADLSPLRKQYVEIAASTPAS
jgi:hypothetical protein